MLDSVTRLFSAPALTSPQSPLAPPSPPHACMLPVKQRVSVCVSPHLLRVLKLATYMHGVYICRLFHQMSICLSFSSENVDV